MINKLFGNLSITEKALDASWIRNEVIADNISNVDTPGYKRKEVKFEEFLQKSISETGIKGLKTDPRHFDIGKTGYKNIRDLPIKVAVDNSNNSMRLDGNNVDIENEMATMAKNYIKYNVLIQNINSGFKMLKSVINEGR
ncbi:MAG TPA: flagellar basal body rod protein FlgB [Clostridiaceae bacterium]|nr:flagellar basal body rod protein FlgB [Clostridiaceae bacterium]